MATPNQQDGASAARRGQNQIDLEIVTPKGRALVVTVDEVAAPSTEGEFGVLPGHAPMVSAIRTGLVTYRQGADIQKCAIGPGFADVGPNKLSIVTDEYVVREDVDPVRVRKELAEIEEQIAKLSAESQTDPAAGDRRRVLVFKENWLAAQLELYGDPPPATMRPAEEWGPPAPMDDADIPQDRDTEDQKTES